MPKYKKCPRCDVNWILEEEDYCEVCQNELKGLAKYEELEDEDDADVCPRCGINFLGENETICEQCRLELEEEKTAKLLDVEIEKDDWEDFEEDALVEEDDTEESLEALVDEEWDEDEAIAEEELSDDGDDDLSLDDFDEIDFDDEDDEEDDEDDDSDL